MEMSFGKHEGKPVSWVLIEDPGYIAWMREQGMDRPELKFALSLLAKLDSIPFKAVKCRGSQQCTNPVTNLVLYKGVFNGGYWFCDSCDPYTHGATKGTLTQINSAARILFHPQADSIIKAIYLAKGGPKIKRPAALKKFFGY